MSGIETIILFVVFAGALFLVLSALNSLFSQEEGKFLSRVTKIAPKSEARPEEWAAQTAAETKSRDEWLKKQALQESSEKADLRDIIVKFTGAGIMENTERKLAQADVPMRASEFLLLQLVLILCPALLIYAITKQPQYSIGAMAAGWFFPGAYLNKLTKARLIKFNNQLADYLVLVVNALRAGQTFMQGVSHAAKESIDPIRTEFGQLLKETNFGMPVEDAMKNVLKRVPSADMDIVCTAFMIQKSVGGNLAEVLDKVAATIRERVRLQGQIRVLTTQGVFSGTVVGLMPFFVGFMIFLINREYIMTLFTTFSGKCCLASAFALWLCGFIAIKKIVTIEL